MLGGPWTPNPKGRPGNFLGSKIGHGGREQCQWVPEQENGGPQGSKGYWKVNMPGKKGWNRYDRGSGEPISLDEAHPGNAQDASPVSPPDASPGSPPAAAPSVPPYLPSGIRFGVGLSLFLYSSPVY